MCSESILPYFEGGCDFSLVETGSMGVKTGKKLLFEHDDGDFLPKGEEDGDFDCEELEEG